MSKQPMKKKAAAKAPAGPTDLAPRKTHVASFTLDEWASHIVDHGKRMELAGNPKGACLVPDPQTGGNNCVLTDQATCTKIGGTWIGGPCGPD